MLGLLFQTAAAAALLQAGSAPPAPLAPARVWPAPKSNPRVVAEIRRLEHEWGQAFVKRDFAFIERIVAPEYRLAAAAPDGKVGITYRDEWMQNSRDFRHDAFESEVIDVATAGNVAVAMVQGLWTVQRRPDRPAQAVRFLVTDTWVKRNGRWQVIYRYSHRLPAAAWPPPGR